MRGSPLTREMYFAWSKASGTESGRWRSQRGKPILEKGLQDEFRKPIIEIEEVIGRGEFYGEIFG